MFGTQRILSSFLSNALSSLLEVDGKSIESSLLQRDGHLSFRNVRLRERKIRVSCKDGIDTFLTILGTVDELKWKWRWSTSARLLETNNLKIHGMHMRAFFLFERTSKPDTESADDTSKTETNFFQDEFQRIKQGLINNLKESDILRTMLNDVLDTLAITLTDIEVRLVVPNEEDQARILPHEIVVGFDSLKFLPELTFQEHSVQCTQYLTANLSVSSLFANVSIETSVFPILEPFSYATAIRRTSGMRFMDLTSGYEIIGSDLSTEDMALAHDNHHGLVVHISTESLGDMRRVMALLTGSSNVEEHVDEALVKKQKHNKKPRRFVQLIFLGIASYLLFWCGYWLFKNELTAKEKRFLASLGYILALFTIIIYLCVCHLLKLIIKKLDQYSSSHRRPAAKSLPGEESGVFRFSLPFISVVVEQEMRLTITNVSLLGRLNGDTMSFSAGSINGRKTTAKGGERINGSGIRATRRPHLWLVNIDCIDECYIPGTFRLLEPVLYTVIRFERGTVLFKVRSIIGEQVEAPSESEEEEPLSELGRFARSLMEKSRKLNDDFYQGIGKLNDDFTQGIAKLKLVGSAKKREVPKVELPDPIKESRRLIHNEVYTEIKKLKIVAMMFEKIPLKKNRHKMRLYPNTFRGNDAVDYVLEHNLSANRREARKLIYDIGVTFNLFEHVCRECVFKDHQLCVFRFVDVKRRRFWDERSIPYSYSDFSHTEFQSFPLPFPLALVIENLEINKPKRKAKYAYLAAKNAELYASPAKVAPALNLTVLVDEVQAKMVDLTGARFHALIDPSLPKEIHTVQISVDSLHASPNYTAEDWFNRFGFNTTGQGNETRVTDKSPIYLPYLYISSFNLKLSWRGLVFATNSTMMHFESFQGSQETTSDDLITYFVMHVLGRAPGLLANFKVLGFNVVEQTGVGTAMNIGAKFIPFGHYISIGALAVYDGVTAAIDAGKVARDDPNDGYRPGDFVRGLLYSAGQATRAGARTRGKFLEDYDEDDHVIIDPLDFVIGTGSGLVKYVYGNKARLVGATVASATMIAATVATGPIAGLFIGLLAGASTEKVIKKMEKSIEKGMHRGNES